MSEKAFGYGVATRAADGVVLDVAFHSLGLGVPTGKDERDLSAPALQANTKIRRVKLENVFCEIELDRHRQSESHLGLRNQPFLEIYLRHK